MAMKNLFRTMMVVAVAAMGITACQNEFDEPAGGTVNDSYVYVSFVADAPTTRTSVDTSSDEAPVFSWDENETFAVLEQTDALAVASSVVYENVEGRANITAAFTANECKESYQYVTVYPAAAYVAAESINNATLTLPASQTMAEASYDPNADLMVSKVVTASAQPTEAQQVQFRRVAAVVKMTLKNFGVELGDEVEKVVFMTEGKALAGTITADLNNVKEFTVAEGVDNVSVATNSASEVYFTTLPTTLEAGDSYTITIITNKKLYVKEGTIPEGKTLSLEAGMVNRFGVDMMGVTGSDKWTLVKDASALKEGDIITFAAKDYDKAISINLYNNTSETSTSARRDAVDILKFESYLIANETVQPFTLVTGAVEGTFSFYDATREKFLVSNNKTSRYLINQSFMDANTSFAISIVAEDGDATVKNIEGGYADNMIRYYNSSKYFYSGTSTNQAICIYKLEGGVGEIPVVAANVTVPDTDEQVVIAEEGAATATTISEVVFNYVGEWTISATTEAEWLNVAYDDANNCLTYTADANTGANREAVVTITAEMEGEESLTWSFNMLQKGAPQEITIAEFVTLGRDENTTYKLTGRITEMTTSSSGTIKLSDSEGNIATLTYIYTDGGEKVYGDNTMGLKVGDVMTATTVIAGTTKGKGGSSTYHSIYKGHYGLDASAGFAADYTGGSVTINVATRVNGTITLPEAITASMTENDFAELSYSGGDTATVTFVSENTTSYVREAVVTFTYGDTSVEVIAQQGINPANKLGYELVTDASTLALNDEIIIVANNSDKALGVSTSTITSQTNFPSADIVKSGNVIYDAEEAGAVVFTLADSGVDGKFALQFVHKETDYYLYIGSSALKGSTSLGNYTKLSIVVDSVSGVATITNSAGTAAIVTFNSTSGKFGSTKVSNDDSTDTTNDIAIYRKQK